MVALLHPQIESPAAGLGRLRLVVDNDPSTRSASGVGPSRNPRSVEVAHGSGAGALDVPMIVGLVVAAVLVFGGLLFVRVSQGSPVADNWDGVVSSGAAAGGVAQTAGPSSAGSNAEIVVAKPGDTMWSLAQELAPESDPRPVVAALIEANGGDSLQIGQQIVIPGQLLD